MALMAFQGFVLGMNAMLLGIRMIRGLKFEFADGLMIAICILIVAFVAVSIVNGECPSSEDDSDECPPIENPGPQYRKPKKEIVPVTFTVDD